MYLYELTERTERYPLSKPKVVHVPYRAWNDFMILDQMSALGRDERVMCAQPMSWNTAQQCLNCPATRFSPAAPIASSWHANAISKKGKCLRG